MNSKPMKRRNLLQAIPFLSFGSLLAKSSNELASCNLTTSDIQGPFYKTNPPTRTKIAADSEPGERLLLSGIVKNTDCMPVENAIVDLWQANSAGVYDSSSNYNLRGQTISDAIGAYSFDTILPGVYSGRPKHLHVKVSKGNFNITTQLYFEGDSLIASDPWASVAAAKDRILAYSKNTKNQWEAFYDFTINQSVITSQATIYPTEGQMIEVFPNPFTDSLIFKFQLNYSANVDLYLTDIMGNTIETIIENQLLPNEKYVFHLKNVNLLLAGFYFLIFSINGKIMSKSSIVKK